MGVALVTGTSTGIGSAIALRLAREGHTVYGSVRSEASGEALLEAAGDLDLHLVLMDVNDHEAVEQGIGAVLEERGGIDILVNNAGISGGLAAIEDTPVSTFESVYGTNVLGGVRCIQAVLPG
ncbi:MAG: SDR family NAD(P)-dependent oxidoreductase, partial [Actinomycetota bacterium]